jgi:outer membrane protein
MTKRLCLALCAALWLAAPLFAQDSKKETTAGAKDAAPAKVPRVAFVDVDEITRRSLYVRDIVKSLEDQLGSRRDSLEKKQIELRRLLEEIELKKAALSEKQFDEKLIKSRSLRLEIENEQYALQKEMRGAERDKMMPALDFILKTIEELGKEEKFDLILRGEIVLYGSPTVNLTDRVIERIDKNPPKTNKVEKKPGDK